MKPFREEDRYLYDLTPDSLVLDVGAHKGAFTREINNRYHCRIYAFEPIAEFYLELRKEFTGVHDRITLHPYGVSGETQQVSMKVKGDMSGAFAEGREQIVQCIGIGELLDRIGGWTPDKPMLPCVDLLKLNIEGMEMSLLEWLLDSGRTKEIRRIQVQPHSVVPQAEQRWAEIDRRLQQTHQLIYFEPWCWSGYTLK